MSKKKGGAEAPEAANAVSVAAHPRARASIRRTRARTALAAFGIVLFLSLSSGVPGQEAAIRALIAGLIGNVAGWACALAVWRSLVMAELKVAAGKHRARAERAAELVEAERQARSEKAATA
jgi:uncharacterized membrane protein YccC